MSPREFAAVDVVRRPAVQFLNFAGNVMKSIEDRFPTEADRTPNTNPVLERYRRHNVQAKAFGPNTLGELLHPVTASYDPEANRTRVGLSYQVPTIPTPREKEAR